MRFRDHLHPPRAAKRRRLAAASHQGGQGDLSLNPPGSGAVSWEARDGGDKATSDGDGVGLGLSVGVGVAVFVAVGVAVDLLGGMVGMTREDPTSRIAVGIGVGVGGIRA